MQSYTIFFIIVNALHVLYVKEYINDARSHERQKVETLLPNEFSTAPRTRTDLLPNKLNNAQEQQ